MKDLSKFTKEQIEAFILGVQETTERGDLISREKELQWKAQEFDSSFCIKAIWLSGIIRAPIVDDPSLQLDDIYNYSDWYFTILKSQSTRKLCAEIVDAIEIINKY